MGGLMLTRRWSNKQEGEKDESKTFRWRVFVYYCNAIADPKTRLAKLIHLINPEEKIRNHRIPYLIEGLASALQGEPSLLYLDHAHQLDTGSRLSIVEAVQIARQTQRVGLAMSAFEDQAQTAFKKMLDDPRSLAEIRLLRLEPYQVMCSMKHYDRRFEVWYEAYKKKDHAAQELSKVLVDHVDGNFARIKSLRESLAEHALGDSLTLDEVRRVIALRTL